MIGARYATLKEGRPEKTVSVDTVSHKSREEAAALVGVGPASIGRAKRILRDGVNGRERYWPRDDIRGRYCAQIDNVAMGMTPQPNTTLLSLHAIARRWGISYSSARRKVRLGHLPFVQLPGSNRPLVPLDAVLQAEKPQRRNPQTT